MKTNEQIEQLAYKLFPHKIIEFAEEVIEEILVSTSAQTICVSHTQDYFNDGDLCEPRYYMQFNSLEENLYKNGEFINIWKDVQWNTEEYSALCRAFLNETLDKHPVYSTLQSIAWTAQFLAEKNGDAVIYFLDSDGRLDKTTANNPITPNYG